MLDVLGIIDSMTGHEIAAVEDAAGMSIASIADEATPKQKLYAALVWQLRCRDEPKLKLSEVLDQTSAQIMRDFEKFDVEEDDQSDQFPAVGDEPAGAGRGPREGEGGVLPGDGAPPE